jgi:membrane-bound serine protease (ClpP class)
MPASNRARSVLPVVIALALSASAIALAAGVLFGQRQVRRTGPASVVRVPVTGVIELGLAPFIERSLKEAAAAKAALVFLDIDTPGGRVDAAEQIVDAIQASPVPVYAFVNRRAFSAGALIALATRSIWMVPGAVIGAATPVTGEGHKAPEKIVSAMRSEMRALAEQRGLDPRIAEAMVDENVGVEGVVEKGKLLTLTTEEAVRVGYASSIPDWNALLHEFDADGAQVHEMRVNWAESLVRFFTHPAVAPLLLSLGVLGLIIEFKTPSFGLAGAAGLTMLGLFFGSRWIVGLAGMEELLLLGAGLVLLIVEATVLPGFGIAGILGLLALGSSLFLSLVPANATAADVGTAAAVLSIAGIAIVLMAWALLRHLPKSGRFARSGLMLQESTAKEIGYRSADVTAELVGSSGIAITDLRPSGVAKIGDERVDVEAEGSFISAGTPVRVIRAEGYRHIVRATE